MQWGKSETKNCLIFVQCHNELYKLGLNEFDMFVGIQQSKVDVKNPMPTRSVSQSPTLSQSVSQSEDICFVFLLKDIVSG